MIRLNLFFILACFLLPYSVTAEYMVISPANGEELRPGEISFSWQRPAGDRTPVELQIKNQRGEIIYRRSSIGTRRTKWLLDGNYQWRAFHPAMGPQDGWSSFQVTDGAARQKIAAPDPISLQEQKVDWAGVRIQKLRQQLLEQIQQNALSAEQFELKLKLLQQGKMGEQEALARMQSILQELEKERLQLQQRIETSKQVNKHILQDEEMIFKAGPRPQLQQGSSDWLTTVRALKEQLYYPHGLQVLAWSEAQPVHVAGVDYWNWRLRFVADHAFGEAVVQDVLVRWRLGQLVEFVAP